MSRPILVALLLVATIAPLPSTSALAPADQEAPTDAEPTIAISPLFAKPLANGSTLKVDFTLVTQVAGAETITVRAPSGLGIERAPVATTSQTGALVGPDIGRDIDGRAYATFYGLSANPTATRTFSLTLKATRDLGQGSTAFPLAFVVEVASPIGGFTYPAGSAVLTLDDLAPRVGLPAPGVGEAGHATTIAFSTMDEALKNATLYWRNRTATGSFDVRGATSRTFGGEFVRDPADTLQLALEAFDQAGNSARVPASGWTNVTYLDTIPPTVSPLPTPPTTWQRNAPAPIELRASDAGQVNTTLTVNYTLDVDGVRIIARSAARNVTIPLTLSGENAINWSATDGTHRLNGSLLYLLDLADPTPGAGFVVPNATTWHDEPITLAFAPAASSPRVPLNASDTAWRVNGTLVPNGERTFGSGTHTIAWSAVSASGRTNASTFTFRVDREAPRLTIDLLGEGDPDARIFNGSVTVRVAATDDASTPTITYTSSSAAASAPWPGEAILSQEGTHTLAFVATDAASKNDTGAVSFVIDRTIRAPTLGPAAWLFRDEATVTAAAADARDAIRCRLDGSEVDMPNTTGAHGWHTLECTSTDAARNTNTSSKTFFVDGRDPTVVSSELPEVVRIAAQIDAVHVLDENGVTAVEGRLGGDGTPFSLTRVAGTDGWVVPPTTTLPAGTPWLEVRATDGAGNAHAAWQRVRPLDVLTTIAPATLSAGPGTLEWRNTPLLLTWTLPSNPGARVKIDGLDAASPFTHAIEGERTLTITTLDDLENSIGQTITVRIDTRVPDVATLLPNLTTTRANVTLATTSGSTTGSPSWVRMWLDGALVGDSGSVTVTDEGLWTISYQAQDLAGNRGPNRTVAVLIDRTPPELSVPDQSLPASGGYLVWHAFDAVGGPAHGTATLRLANGTDRTLVWSPTGAAVGALPIGQHELIVVARDPTENSVTRTALVAVGLDLPPRANTAPTVASVGIRFERSVASALVGAVADAEGDAVHLSYLWTVDGVPAGATGTTFAPPVDREVRLIVTPFDGRNVGTPVRSDRFVRPASPPTPVLEMAGSFLVGEPVVFSALASTDADGTIERYAWRFSDNSVGDGAVVPRIMPGGVGWAQLTVVDENDLASTTIRHFLVLPRPIAPTPVPTTTTAAPIEEPSVGSPTQATFETRLADGTPVSVPLPGPEAQVVREAAVRGDPLVLIGSPAGLQVWRPGIAELEPATEIGAVASETSFERDTQLVDVDVPPASGWRIVTIDDPHPLRPILAVTAPDGTLAPFWRDGDRLGFITDVDEVQIRYQLEPLRAIASVTPEGDVARVVASTPGSVGAIALAILEGGAPAGGVTAIDATSWAIALGPVERALELVATDGAGRRAFADLVVPAAPIALEKTSEAAPEQEAGIVAAQQDTPGIGIVGTVFALVAAVLVGFRRRRG